MIFITRTINHILSSVSSSSSSSSSSFYLISCFVSWLLSTPGINDKILCMYLKYNLSDCFSKIYTKLELSRMATTCSLMQINSVRMYFSPILKTMMLWRFELSFPLLSNCLSSSIVLGYSWRVLWQSSPNLFHTRI